MSMHAVTMDNVVGTKVLIHLQPEAYEVLDVQGIEDRQFVARVVGFDQFGLWVENPNYCTTPVYTDDGAYIPPEERGEICHRALMLLQWGYIQTILQFPDRPTYGAALNAREIGFSVQPHPAEALAPKARPKRRAPAKAKPVAKPAAPARPAQPAKPAKPVRNPKSAKAKGAKRG